MHATRLIHLAQGPVTRQTSARLAVRTTGRGLVDLTEPVCNWVADNDFSSGLLTLFCPHTSASVILQENTDPDVHDDLLDALDRLAPRNVPYRHHTEGTDDMPAHIKTALTASNLVVPIVEGRLALGMWQAIYLVELRDRAHERNVLMHCIGI